MIKLFQNNKVYIGREFARNLTAEERKNLEMFAKQMAENNVSFCFNNC